MAIYMIIAHNVIDPNSVHREFAYTRNAAMLQAEQLFNRGDHHRVDVFSKSPSGLSRQIHHIEREPTQVERGSGES